MSAPRKKIPMVFIDLLKRFPIMLSNSKRPEIRNRKEKAIEVFSAALREKTTLNYTTPQIIKKIHNMKTEVRRKLVLKKTGNREVFFKVWEQEFVSLLNTNKINHVVKDSKSVNGTKAITKDVQIIEENSNIITFPINITKPKELKDPPMDPLNFCFDFETNETQHLDNQKLQRLVLLKQLTVLKLKEQKLMQTLSNEVIDNGFSLDTEIKQEREFENVIFE